MKKIKFLAVPAIAVLLFAGCAPSESATVNRAPSIDGVRDIQCIVGTTVDFLDGVAALDREDGDITPDMKISVTPEVEVNNGYAVFTEIGTYEVNYTVADSEGRETTKRAEVEVIERELYRSFVQPQGFSVQAEGSATIVKSGMVNGEYILKASGGEIAEDIKLSRTYSLIPNVQYTFDYKVNSNFAGKIKVTADGDDCAELAVKEGVNTFTFAHTARSDEEFEQDVQIDLCLGGQESDIDWKILSVENEYTQAESEPVERIPEDFSFADKCIDRFDGASGSIGVAEDGKSAFVEITGTADQMYKGGMFINTGVSLDVGMVYSISYDIQSEQDNDFDVVIQYRQWGPDEVIRTVPRNAPHQNIEITINSNTQGTLWLYIQSGTALNKITISNLSVKAKPSTFKRVTFALEDFTESHEAGYNSILKTDCGSVQYYIENFSAKDDHHTVNSPSFYVGGSAENFVITFKAKASKPIEAILAAPVAGGWDPTLMWTRIYLTEEEQTYTYFCSGESSDNFHKFVWQFGSAANQKYENVTIEISDIKISYKNGELDV